jgi:hypothetical protein
MSGVSNTFSMEVLGLPEVKRALNGLKKKFQTEALREASFEAGSLMAREARARVPRAFGLLYRSIGLRVNHNMRRGIYYAYVGAMRNVTTTRDGKIIKPSKYLHLVEFGTKPHKVRRPGWGKTSWTMAQWRGKVYTHPGTKGSYPMTRTINATRGRSLLAYVGSLRRSLKQHHGRALRVTSL